MAISLGILKTATKNYAAWPIMAHGDTVDSL